ncbi:ubiquinol-cytochrome c reductase iron-sulfur subunit [Gluconobacter wancherniae NBRC 103581]|uniref:Ubiquinol-cytochrome c reductase iron-sulfur subunit n=2 Tax=Gluconobacter wancherniae TaxID=1307955 RepID=A0A511B0X8_9PROT|nr:ubiquinol-cytochrome c reductase iron-sulfur subunit [Gluconobacter wancherniae NBRC 103581]GBR65218.1 ubiquinol-cytochrome c reductase iron-sulfur subunit [Gluconobacter wancherniae NBRC 103581]GEK94110.1 ubiquinol-cytochrome c reductase iron-sulfur subunit [Gluconobacter wancherniae NBRC 103581]
MIGGLLSKRETMTSDQPSSPSETEISVVESAPKRRDVLASVTVGLGCAGACALAYPFLDSLNGTRGENAAEDDTIEVDLSAIAPGQQVIVKWRGWPVFVQRRTPDMLAALRAPGLDQRLRDPASTIMQQPKDAANWHRSVVPEIGVYVGICTHLGCVPNYDPPSTADTSGHYACPCHGSQFDAAGRAFKDAPAPYNLPVPPVTMLTPNRVQIGKSKGDPGFDIANIQQI